MDTKETYLIEFAHNIIASLTDPEICGRKNIVARPINGRLAEVTPGPRAGAVTLLDTNYSNHLIETFRKHDGLLAHKLLPNNWKRKVDHVSVYGFRGCVRVEAAWPKAMQKMDVTVSLSRIDKNPYKNGRFLIGKNERGADITLGLDDVTPNFLFAGLTGSGKTWAMRSVIGQLSRYIDTQTILIDGKYGDGLGCLNGIRGQIGPLAVDIENAKNALAWVINEMHTRYTKVAHLTPQARKATFDEMSRIVVVIDEVQEFTNDLAAAAMISKLVSQCRGAKIYCLIGTQHPRQDAFGDTSAKRNLVGRIVLLVEDEIASHVALGSWTPKAHEVLLGKGDAYAKVPGAIQRVQTAYIPEDDLLSLVGGQPLLKEWPLFNPDILGFYPERMGRPPVLFTMQELAISARCASLNERRIILDRHLQKHTGKSMGVPRLRKLLEKGKELDAELGVLNYGGE